MRRRGKESGAGGMGPSGYRAGARCAIRHGRKKVRGEEELTGQGPSGGKRRRGRECWAVVGNREGGLGRFRPGEENGDFFLFLLDFWFGIWEGILKSGEFGGEYFGLSGDF